MINQQKSKHWFLQLKYLVVVVFLVGSTLFHGSGQTRIVGMLLAGLAMILQFDPRTSIFRGKYPLELKLFLWWVIWSVGTGIIVADVPQMVLFHFPTMVQIVILQWAIYALCFRQQETNYFYWTLIVVALIQVLASYLGYQYDKAGDEVVLGDAFVDVEGTNRRIEGLTGNANSLGFSLLAGVWACIMLWKTQGWSTKFFKLPILLGVMVICSYFAVQTASRKSLLTLALLVSSWLVWLIPGRFSVKNAIIVTAMLVIAIVMVCFGFNYIMNDTIAGHRFQLLIDAGGGNAMIGFKEANVRYLMYVEGLKMWLQHPVFGVGMGNFQVHFFTGQYSHSDYVEPLACNGIVGFVLYQGFAFVILRRIYRLLKVRLPENISYLLKGMFLFLIFNHYVVGFGCPHWDGIQHCVIMTFIIAYSLKIQKQFVENRFVYMT